MELSYDIIMTILKLILEKRVVKIEAELRLVADYRYSINEASVRKHEISVRVGGFTGVTMKNAVFWDIRLQFVHKRKHITSPLESPAGSCYVRF
jgi:hypothetical protein